MRYSSSTAPCENSPFRLPALLPVVAFRGHGSTDLTVLAAVGVVGCVALVLAAVCARAGDKSYGS